MHRNNFFWLAVCVGLIVLAFRYSPRKETKSSGGRALRVAVTSQPAPAPAVPKVEPRVEPPAVIVPEPAVAPEATRTIAVPAVPPTPMPVPSQQEILQGRATRKVEAHFGELFRQLAAKGVDPALLRQMLFEREMLSNNGSGIFPVDAARQQLTDMKRAVGSPVFKEYEHYLGSLPERLVANDLAGRLAGTAAPLTDEQREWFIAVLHGTYASNGERQLATAPLSVDEFRYIVRQVPDSAVEPLRRGLTPAQMDVFLAIRAEQVKRHPTIPR